MTHPVPQPIGTGYGVPGNWAAGHHTGVDYLSPNGTTAVAVLPGKVIYAGWNGWGRAYGRTVIVEHTLKGVTYRAIYAHLAEWLVNTGDKVTKGQPVAKTNNTGNTSGPHLHYEVRVYPFSYGDDVSPSTLTSAVATVPALAAGTVTVFDVCNWNVASPRWFTPWAPRAAGINDEIRGEASVYGFQEVYAEDQAGTLQAGLGSSFTRVPGRAGLELFYDSTKWQLERPAKSYPSGVQGRYALVVHLTRKTTGQHVAFVVFHAPAATTDSVKTAYGQWLYRLLNQIDGPILLMGDANRSVEDKSPRKEIRAAGFRDMRDQAAVTNENAKEFPSKNWNLCDIWTDLNDSHDDKIVGGIVDLTSARLSDHRRIEATVKVTA